MDENLVLQFMTTKNVSLLCTYHRITGYNSLQVHTVKKSSKWECKMCGEKQSIKKVLPRIRSKSKILKLYII
jgi:ubiquitin C-terminal hydrolase